MLWLTSVLWGSSGGRTHRTCLPGLTFEARGGSWITGKLPWLSLCLNTYDYYKRYCLWAPTTCQEFNILSLAKFSQQPYELGSDVLRECIFINSFKNIYWAPPTICSVSSFLEANGNIVPVSWSLQSSWEITITQIITDQCIQTLLATCQIELFQTILSCYHTEIYIYILKIRS